MSSNIKVAVRCRPLFEKERAAVGLDIQSRRISVDLKTYDPDYTFHPTASQEDVFACCAPIIQSVKDGLNGTVIVYGQTGTGKTHTMLGSSASSINNNNSQNSSADTSNNSSSSGGGSSAGVAYMATQQLLEHVKQKTLDGAQIALTLSMVEIYNEQLTDMLSENGKAEVTLIGGFPRCTTRVTLCEVADAVAAIEKGLTWRHTASTLMNDRSSRSHVVIMLDLEEYNSFTEVTDVAHLFLVDLAGSESLKKSQASGVAAAEAGKINKSLLALKSVFLALSNTTEATRPTHVPYRDSKLTEMLQDSIGGTARTLLIACISSVGRDLEETKSTLMYACKARSIRNSSNTEREKLMIRLRSYEVENRRLRNRLDERVNERGGYYINKEDHERFVQTEEEVKTLRPEVEELRKAYEEREARVRISFSQLKILQSVYEERDAELQRFKGMHYEALRKFENQAHLISRIVQEGTNRVRGVFTARQADCTASFEAWKRTCQEALSAETTNRKEEEEEEESSSSNPTNESIGSGIRTAAADVARVVGSINASFKELCNALCATVEQHRCDRTALEKRRADSVSSMAARLRETVVSELARFEKEQTQLDADDRHLVEILVSSAASKCRFPEPATPSPFMNIIESVQQSTLELADMKVAPAIQSLCEGSDEMEGGGEVTRTDKIQKHLDEINEKVRKHTTDTLLGVMEPLQSIAAQHCSTGTLSSSSAAAIDAVVSALWSASSQQQQQQQQQQISTSPSLASSPINPSSKSAAPSSRSTGISAGGGGGNGGRSTAISSQGAAAATTTRGSRLGRNSNITGAMAALSSSPNKFGTGTGSGSGGVSSSTSSAMMRGSLRGRRDGIGSSSRLALDGEKENHSPGRYANTRTSSRGSNSNNSATFLAGKGMLPRGQTREPLASSSSNTTNTRSNLVQSSTSTCLASELRASGTPSKALRNQRAAAVDQNMDLDKFDLEKDPEYEDNEIDEEVEDEEGIMFAKKRLTLTSAMGSSSSGGSSNLDDVEDASSPPLHTSGSNNNNNNNDNDDDSEDGDGEGDTVFGSQIQEETVSASQSLGAGFTFSSSLSASSSPRTGVNRSRTLLPSSTTSSSQPRKRFRSATASSSSGNSESNSTSCGSSSIASRLYNRQLRRGEDNSTTNNTSRVRSQSGAGRTAATGSGSNHGSNRGSKGRIGSWR